MKNNLSRRNFLNRIPVLGIPVALAMTPTQSYANFTSIATKNMITVGDGGDFSDFKTAVESIADAGPENRYTVLLLPGRHKLASIVTIPMYVHIVGVDRHACELVSTVNWGRIKCSNNTSFQNMTCRYTPLQGGRDFIKLTTQTNITGEPFWIENVSFYHDSTAFACIRIDRSVRPVLIRDVDIFTSGIGINQRAGGQIYLFNTNIFLTGEATGQNKICARSAGGGRMYVFGGKFGTGYGASQISNDPNVDFIGFQIENANRFQIENGWMIVRQDAPAATGRAVCFNIQNPDPTTRVRINGGYYMAENENRSAPFIDIDNAARARVELYPATRVRGNRVIGPTTSVGPTAGVDTLTAGRYVLDAGEGGLKKCDTSGGDIDIIMGSGTILGSVTTFIRTSGSGNIVISGQSGETFDGQLSVTVGQNQYDKLLVQYLGDEYITW